jgi:hypothetical protein
MADRTFTPPTREEADWHAVLARDLVVLLATGDRTGAATLLAKSRADDTVDPWNLAIGAASLAAGRPRAQPRGTRRS